MESLDQPSYSAWGTKAAPNGLFSLGYHLEGGPLPVSNEPPNVDGGIHIEMDPALQRRALEAKKRQLLTLLEVVSDSTLTTISLLFSCSDVAFFLG